MLIVIEGVDGSGKQTQSELLQERLEQSGKHVRKLAFPNYQGETSALVKMYLGGKFGENPNDINPYAASVFYAADRIGSFLSDWRKDYESDGVILCDRYTTSNAVHQSCKLEGDERDAYLDWLFDFEYNLVGLPKPDLVIFLNMPPEFGRELTKNRANKITGTMEKDIHEKNSDHIESAYNATLYTAKRFGWHIVDCVKDGCVRTIEDINNEIYETVIKNA